MNNIVNNINFNSYYQNYSSFIIIIVYSWGIQYFNYHFSGNKRFLFIQNRYYSSLSEIRASCAYILVSKQVLCLPVLLIIPTTRRRRPGRHPNYFARVLSLIYMRVQYARHIHYFQRFIFLVSTGHFVGWTQLVFFCRTT